VSSEVLLASLGIAGTLIGALGGAALAAWATLRQVRAQATVDHARWLQGQRQEAYVTLLAACEEVARSAEEPMQRRLDETYASADYEAMWNPTGRAFAEAKCALVRVSIVGPPTMDTASAQLFDQAVVATNQVSGAADDDPDFFVILSKYRHALKDFDAQQREFASQAQKILGAVTLAPLPPRLTVRDR